MENSISLTDSAAKRVQQLLNKYSNASGLLITVITSGCSGLAYKLSIAQNIKENDYYKFISHNINIFIDKESFVYVSGTVINHKVEGLSSGFEFANPNVKAECGCGESFSVTKAAQ